MPAQSSATFKEFFEAARERPVYVVLGVQGSGTNLLSRLLVRIFGFSVLQDRSMVFRAVSTSVRQPVSEFTEAPPRSRSDKGPDRREAVAVCR